MIIRHVATAKEPEPSYTVVRGMEVRTVNRPTNATKGN